MVLDADVAAFLRLWNVQLKPGGGLCPAAFRAVCNHFVLVLAVYFVLSSSAVMAHLRVRIFPFLSVPLKNAFMARATLGMSSASICLMCFNPLRRCWWPFSLLRRRVMWVVFTTRSFLLAHAPHSSRQNKL